MLYHKPVLLKESLEGLNIKPGGDYVDATFGGGGHSKAILEVLKEGRLVAFDQDDEARQEAEKIEHRSFTFCQANFRHIKQYLKLHGIRKVDGILADLGVSSHQIDSSYRGFSTRFEGPLDMRMDRNGSLTAAEVLNHYEEARLHQVLGMYGEVRNARTLAKAISQRRSQKSFERSSDLMELLKPLAPRGKEFKYYAQVFQALRIEVNKELEALESFLGQCAELIAEGGRLVMISYHSLEDRMVKNFIRAGNVYGNIEKDLYGNSIKPFEAVHRKPVEASEEEVKENSRARSAKLRVAERIEQKK